MTSPKSSKILEVIVSSLPDAIEAQAGGADRLEVVRNLEVGGLTPDLDLVQQIMTAVHIPVRVMLRHQNSMTLQDAAELEKLSLIALEFSRIGVDGLVAGFLRNDQVDLTTLRAISGAVPRMKITFHRAFDELSDPLAAIRALKTIPQVDRILTTGGPGTWPERKLRLHLWQRCASPEITILAGAGLLEPVITDLCGDSEISEIHIGRAARIPKETSGKVSRGQVARLKGLSA
jgi:copper homeostasis protein